MKKTLFYLGCILPVISLLTYASCRSGSLNKEGGNLSLLRSDSVIKDIPYTADGKPDMQYLLKDTAEKQAGFQTLERGFDSLAIRIWYEATVEPVGQVVELTKVNSEWNAHLFLIHYALSGPKKDSVIVVKKDDRTAVPKSGWDIFINKLDSLQILSMKSDITLPGYVYPMDGSGVVFQIATKNTYRYYFYNAIEINDDNFWQARNVRSVLELIDKEFDFPRIK